jgi:hypothetical protein
MVVALGSVSGAGAVLSPQTSKPPVMTLQERLGYSANTKLLIVHADDLGMAHSINMATIKAFESEIVNSGSVMVPCPWFPEIAAYARNHPDADLGIHLTLTSEWTTYRWGPVLPKDRVASLLDDDGYFYLTGNQFAAHMALPDVENEVRAQIDRARRFGIQPTHLDPHMGTLLKSQALAEIFLRVGREYRLPVRMSREYFAQAPFLRTLVSPNDIVIDRVIALESNLQPKVWSKFYVDAIKNLQPGVTEILVHLAYDDEEMRAATIDHPDWGAAWRYRDFQFVTSDAFRRLLQENDVKLITWREIGKLLAKSAPQNE